MEGGGCTGSLLLEENSGLKEGRSLGQTGEGAEGSLALLGMNCLNAADCDLEERNFSTTVLTASPNRPNCEIGASRRKTFSLSQISVRLSHR